MRRVGTAHRKPYGIWSLMVGDTHLPHYESPATTDLTYFPHPILWICDNFFVSWIEKYFRFDTHCV